MAAGSKQRPDIGAGLPAGLTKRSSMSDNRKSSGQRSALTVVQCAMMTQDTLPWERVLQDNCP
jgi:hypothetical protein